MFFCGKKVAYLSLLEEGTKISSAGFAGLQADRGEVLLRVEVRHITAEHGWYSLCLQTEEGDITIGRIEIRCGSGCFARGFSLQREKICTGNKELTLDGIQGVRIPLNGKRSIWGEWQRQAAEDRNDKWQELLKNYRKVHPFGDKRECILLEPGELAILRKEFQGLKHNSFLLHGFYNYRHLILGKEEEKYYLGVPGVLFEREKAAAVMFGFERFETEGEEAVGKFGYYIRTVAI